MNTKQAYYLGVQLALKQHRVTKLAELILPAEALAATLKARPDESQKTGPRATKKDDPKDPPDNMRWSKSGPHGYDTMTTLGLTFPDPSTYGL